jgi:hypothetical protein
MVPVVVAVLVRLAVQEAQQQAAVAVMEPHLLSQDHQQLMQVEVVAERF